MAKTQRRLFLALWPDAAVRQQLRDLANDQLPRGARLTHLEDLHMTLQFLGSVAEQRTGFLSEALAGVVHPAFELSLTHTGYWKRSQVWWCMPEEIPQALNGLVDTLASALEAIGFDREARPYRPHVTLARKVRRAAAGRLSNPIAWQAQEFVLVESNSGADPPRYRRLQTWPLQGPEKGGKQR